MIRVRLLAASPLLSLRSFPLTSRSGTRFWCKGSHLHIGYCIPIELCRAELILGRIESSRRYPSFWPGFFLVMSSIWNQGGELNPSPFPFSGERQQNHQTLCSLTRMLLNQHSDRSIFPIPTKPNLVALWHRQSLCEQLLLRLLLCPWCNIEFTSTERSWGNSQQSNSFMKASL